jgi:hypothetical protein
MYDKIFVIICSRNRFFLYLSAEKGVLRLFLFFADISSWRGNDTAMTARRDPGRVGGRIKSGRQQGLIADTS